MQARLEDFIRGLRGITQTLSRHSSASLTAGGTKAQRKVRVKDFDRITGYFGGAGEFVDFLVVM